MQQQLLECSLSVFALAAFARVFFSSLLCHNMMMTCEHVCTVYFSFITFGKFGKTIETKTFDANLSVAI